MSSRSGFLRGFVNNRGCSCASVQEQIVEVVLFGLRSARPQPRSKSVVCFIWFCDCAVL